MLGSESTQKDPTMGRVHSVITYHAWANSFPHHAFSPKVLFSRVSVIPFRRGVPLKKLGKGMSYPLQNSDDGTVGLVIVPIPGVVCIFVPPPCNRVNTKKNLRVGGPKICPIL